VNSEYVAWGWIADETPTEGAKRPRIEGETWTEGAARDWAVEGLGKGIGEPLPRKLLKMFTWNCAIWCIVKNFSFTISTFLSLPSCICAVQTGAIVRSRISCFSPAICFFACDSFFACNSFLWNEYFGAIVNNNKHWLMTWILEQAADASFYELTSPKHWQTTQWFWVSGCR
jgi:hypothetical protein